MKKSHLARMRLRPSAYMQNVSICSKCISVREMVPALGRYKQCLESCCPICHRLELHVVHLLWPDVLAAVHFVLRI
ncbi:hypothetical protein BDZ89DRAFT_447906 [Hymenopellis radicata]|nr:hypothetical protein BDZ89DRAFT_447906 [Hymenopellis radicata]